MTTADFHQKTLLVHSVLSSYKYGSAQMGSIHNLVVEEKLQAGSSDFGPSPSVVVEAVSMPVDAAVGMNKTKMKKRMMMLLHTVLYAPSLFADFSGTSQI